MDQQPLAATQETTEFRDRLLDIGRRAGLVAVGVAPVSRQQPAFAVLSSRKAEGFSGSMQFTYRNPERSTDPRRHLPSAKAIVVGALRYGGSSQSPDGNSPQAVDHTRGPRLSARVARYARGNSYELLAQALESMAEELRRAGYRAVVVADSNHLVDRNAAWEAGIGWYGKNSNLLVPDVGSWVVLGSILTDARMATTGPPASDQCGRCQACITDCPTDAIVAPGVVDASRCIAWLVQAGEPIPRSLRPAVGDRIYGCDDCQDVCPVGSPDYGYQSDTTVSDEERQTASLESSFPDVLWILDATDDELLTRYGHWYIADRNPDVIRRTALVVLGNTARSQDSHLIESVLSRYLRSQSTLLVQHAVWAAQQLDLTHLIPDSVRDSENPVIKEELKQHAS